MITSKFYCDEMSYIKVVKLTCRVKNILLTKNVSYNNKTVIKASSRVVVLINNGHLVLH